MSIAALAAVFALDKVEPWERLVLLALAWDTRNGRIRCAPGMDALVTMTGYSERHIRRIMVALSAPARPGGPLIHRAGGGYRDRTSEWVFLIPMDEKGGRGSPPLDGGKADQRRTQGGHGRPPLKGTQRNPKDKNLKPELAPDVASSASPLHAAMALMIPQRSTLGDFSTDPRNRDRLRRIIQQTCGRYLDDQQLQGWLDDFAGYHWTDERTTEQWFAVIKEWLRQGNCA